MPPDETDVGVLIVGAGPTGLMLAIQLLRQGVSVRLIERNAGPVRESRALGVQARTLEFYAQLGIAEAAIASGRRGTGASLWARGRRMARVPIGDAGRGISPYPYILVLGQDENERLLGERLQREGGQVEWSTSLVGFETRQDHVVAAFERADGTRGSVRARYVAGCDGAHSAVRHAADIEFPGAPYAQVFFVADVVARGPMVADEVNVYLWRGGFHLFFPLRGLDRWRIVGIVPPGLDANDALRVEDVMPDLQRNLGDALEVRDCAWFAKYRIHHRRAARFRRGRALLLGDAAHIHSPVGAQGMNTGLQDACNLAWKLAAVLQGRAADRLLDTYAEERERIAERLLSTTDRAFRVIVSKHPLARLLRTQVVTRVAALLMRSPGIQQAAFRTVSQTGLHYRSGRLARATPGLPKDAPQPGDRFPWLQLNLAGGGPPVDLFARLDGRRCVLLLFGQRLPSDARLDPALVDVIEVPGPHGGDQGGARAGIPAESYYLLRPDGYIGLAGARCTSAALGDWLRLGG